ncbi:MAG TPA: alpha/beta hydrolase, partial [Stellaceae bacterium]|nr:alpha/beta hydrolase [Stellaceae bacterium]
ARLAVMRGEAPKRGRLPISVPSRVLWGANDPILKSEWSDRLDEFFSDVEVSTAPEAGHFVHYEQPTLACREIEAFFRKV